MPNCCDAQDFVLPRMPIVHLAEKFPTPAGKVPSTTGHSASKGTRAEAP